RTTRGGRNNMATTPVGRRRSESSERRESNTANAGGRAGKSNGAAKGTADTVAERSAHRPKAVAEAQLDDLLAALRAVRAGDFSARLNTRRGGLLAEIA